MTVELEKIETIIPKGSLLTITTGVYSDYTMQGVFRALDDIDANKLRADYLIKYPRQGDSYCFSSTQFLAEISHLLDPINCFEFHLDNYGTISAMDITAVE